jgi:hypothetical protein
MESLSRACTACRKIIRGRTDKKFCNDHCRNTYNNQLRAPENAYIRSVTLSIRKNRSILQMMLGKKKNMQVNRNELLEHGFRFRYHTHLENLSIGSNIVCCFDVGYQTIEQDKILVLRLDTNS